MNKLPYSKVVFPPKMAKILDQNPKKMSQG